MSTRAKKNLQRKKSGYSVEKTKSDMSKRPQSKAKLGSYRIIGGTWRSRRLSFPGLEGLRPTTDRVRETVFNWVNTEIQGAHVLDMFAGSGSLGLEALSRGAAELLAIEKNKQAVQALQANVDVLMPTPEPGIAAKVIQADALVYIKSLKTAQADAQIVPQSFDLIFLDPPFRKGLLEEMIGLLDGHPILKEGVLIYIEREKDMMSLSLPEDWQLLKDKTAGQVVYQLFRVKNAHTMPDINPNK